MEIHKVIKLLDKSHYNVSNQINDHVRYRSFPQFVWKDEPFYLTVEDGYDSINVRFTLTASIENDNGILTVLTRNGIRVDVSELLLVNFDEVILDYPLEELDADQTYLIGKIAEQILENINFN